MLYPLEIRVYRQRRRCRSINICTESISSRDDRQTAHGFRSGFGFIEVPLNAAIVAHGLQYRRRRRRSVIELLGTGEMSSTCPT